jgi:hypothetical protein
MSTIAARERLLLQLAEMPAFLQPFAALAPALLRARPGCDNAPLIEHLWHLADCDRELYGARIERVLQQSRPELPPVQVGDWPDARGYLQRDAAPAVQAFADARGRLIERLRALPEADFARDGLRFDGSLVDVAGLVEQIADHDRDHRRRMTAVLVEALQARAAVGAVA